MLAGMVNEVGKSGDIYRLAVSMPGVEKPVSIYSAAKPAVAKGDSVVIMGSIVVNPKETLHNFSDDESTVVWQGSTVKTPGK